MADTAPVLSPTELKFTADELRQEKGITNMPDDNALIHAVWETDYKDSMPDFNAFTNAVHDVALQKFRANPNAVEVTAPHMGTFEKIVRSAGQQIGGDVSAVFKAPFEIAGAPLAGVPNVPPGASQAQVEAARAQSAQTEQQATTQASQDLARGAAFVGSWIPAERAAEWGLRIGKAARLLGGSSTAAQIIRGSTAAGAAGGAGGGSIYEGIKAALGGDNAAQTLAAAVSGGIGGAIGGAVLGAGGGVLGAAAEIPGWILRRAVKAAPGGETIAGDVADQAANQASIESFMNEAQGAATTGAPPPAEPAPIDYGDLMDARQALDVADRMAEGWRAPEVPQPGRPVGAPVVGTPDIGYPQVSTLMGVHAPQDAAEISQRLISESAQQQQLDQIHRLIEMNTPPPNKPAPFTEPGGFPPKPIIPAATAIEPYRGGPQGAPAAAPPVPPVTGGTPVARVNSVVKDVLKGPDTGYTFNADMTEHTDDGWIAGLQSKNVPAGSQNEIAQAIMNARREASNWMKQYPGKVKVGVWRYNDSETGRPMVSVDINAYTPDKEQAIRIGQATGQQSIVGLFKGQEPQFADVGGNAATANNSREAAAAVLKQEFGQQRAAPAAASTLDQLDAMTAEMKTFGKSLPGSKVITAERRVTPGASPTGEERRMVASTGQAAPYTGKYEGQVQGGRIAESGGGPREIANQPYVPAPEAADVQSTGRKADLNAPSLGIGVHKTSGEPYDIIGERGGQYVARAGNDSEVLIPKNSVQLASNGFEQGLAQAEADARNVLKASRGTLFANPIPVKELNAMATLGAGALYRGGKKAFTSELIAEFGPAVREHLPMILERAQAQLAKLSQSVIEGSSMPNTKRLLTLMNEGKDAADWYNASRNELTPIFGKDTPLFMKQLAATSVRTAPELNLQQAMDAYVNYKLGKPNKGLPAKTLNLERISAGADQLSGQKVREFTRALNGDQNAVVVDAWMSRLFGFGDSPNQSQFNFIKGQVRAIARANDMTPSEAQAAMWVAFKRETEGPGSDIRGYHQILQDWEAGKMPKKLRDEMHARGGGQQELALKR